MTDAETARFARATAVVSQLSALDRFDELDDVALWARHRCRLLRTPHQGAPR